jgi:hypothetical protein
MNLKTPETQAAQSPSNAMRPLTDQELDAIVGGRITITVTNSKGEKTVIVLE